MLYFRLFVAAFLLQIAAASPAAAEPKQSGTSIEDLDALAAAQSWAELHDRLMDISPASRNAHWNSLVEQAALGELAAQTAPGGSAADRFAALERYYPKFPSLAKSAKFLALRTSVGLAAFERCFDEGGHDGKCRNDLERFVHGAPVTAELALGAAHLIGVKFNHQAAPLFYALGIDAPGGQAICTDSELQYDLIRALELPADYSEAKEARTLTEKCWDTVKPAVAANVAKTAGEGYYMKNACPALIQHNALKGLLEKRCQLAIKQ